MAAGDGDQPASAGSEQCRELARVLHRHPLVALGVEEQHGDLERFGRGPDVVVGQKSIEGGVVGGEREAPVVEAAPKAAPRWRGRSHTAAVARAAAADTSAR